MSTSDSSDRVIKPEAREHSSGWISVEDRMPEPETECLVYGETKWSTEPCVCVDTWTMQREAPLSFSSATIEIGYGWDEHEYEEVTHWMPLPAPPIRAHATEEPTRPDGQEPGADVMEQEG
jgi:hypothetical protein